MSKYLDTVDPVVTVNGRETETTHPSYAQIGVSRVSGQVYLYGSDMQHLNHVSLRIRRSSSVRTLSEERYHAGEEIIEVRMSEAQWATFVSSGNTFGGVPCTLTRLMGKGVPSIPPPPPVAEKFSSDLNATLQSILDRISEVEKAMSGPLSKTKVEALRSSLENIRDHLTANTEFVAEQFVEHMEQVVEDAKSEVNAYATQTLVRLGLDSTNSPIALPEHKDEK